MLSWPQRDGDVQLARSPLLDRIAAASERVLQPGLRGVAASRAFRAAADVAHDARRSRAAAVGERCARRCTNAGVAIALPVQGAGGDPAARRADAASQSRRRARRSRRVAASSARRGLGNVSHAGTVARDRGQRSRTPGARQRPASRGASAARRRSLSTPARCSRNRERRAAGTAAARAGEAASAVHGAPRGGRPSGTRSAGCRSRCDRIASTSWRPAASC